MKKNRSYVLSMDGSTLVTCAVSYLVAPAPACAAYLARKHKTSGRGLLVNRENWKLLKCTLEQLADLYRSGKLPWAIPEGLVCEIQEFERERQDMATAES